MPVPRMTEIGFKYLKKIRTAPTLAEAATAAWNLHCVLKESNEVLRARRTDDFAEKLATVRHLNTHDSIELEEKGQFTLESFDMTDDSNFLAAHTMAGHHRQ